MEKIRLQAHPQDAEPVDAATMAAVEAGLAQIDRGQTVTLEQSNIILRKRLQAWRKAEAEVLSAK